MIIIEGTDKSGKTTLLSNLIKLLPNEKKMTIKPMHFGLLPENWDYCDDYISFIKSNYILDRFIDSERAYGVVYRKKINPKLTQKNMIKVYRKCAEIGAITIHCKPDINEVIKRIEKEKDEMIKKTEDLISLRNQFYKIFNEKYPLEKIEIDTSKQIDPSILKNIIEKSIILEKKAISLNQFNFNCSITPSSKYLIYTDKCFDDIMVIVDEIYNGSLSDFAFVSSRNIENKPSEIKELIFKMPKIEKILILGEQSMEDIEKTNTKTPTINCKNIKNLLDAISKF